MRSKLPRSIRNARRAAGLTQEQLGRILGLKGRAVYRWENGETAPTKRHQRALVRAIQGFNSGAAVALAAALAAEQGDGAVKPAEPATSEPAAPPLSPPAALELAVFRMADELDLPPRRLRRPLLRLIERLRATSLTLEAIQGQVEAWIADER